MTTRINFNVFQRSLDAVIQEFRDGSIRIPSHQREYTWDIRRQRKLIDTIKQGMPIPAILIRSSGRGVVSNTLEDGQQRLTTILNFVDNKTEDSQNLTFEKLPVDVRERFKNYPLPIMMYSNASNSQAIEIFDRFQNGVPLSLGERYHSLSELSPLVKLTKDLFLTPGEGFFERSKKIWGDKSGSDKKKKNLASLVAIVAAAAFGAEYLSKKWDDMADICRNDITEENMTKTHTIMDMMLNIYEKVDEAEPLSKKMDINYQFDPGHFTAYIVYSLLKFGDCRDGWIEYLTSVRRDKARYGGKIANVLKEVLHKDIKLSRSWTSERWEMGYLRVFDPEEAERRSNDTVSSHESYVSDEDSD